MTMGSEREGQWAIVLGGANGVACPMRVIRV